MRKIDGIFTELVLIYKIIGSVFFEMTDFYGRKIAWRQRMGAKRGRYGKYKRRVRRRRNQRTSGFIGLETKFSDNEKTSAAIATTWTTINPTTDNCLNGLVQDDTENGRDGRVYHITSIHMKIGVNSDASEEDTAPQSDVQVRMCLVLDTQTNGTEMSAADCMVSDQTYDVLAFRNLANSQRFRVLKDKTVIVRRDVMAQGAVNLFATAVKYNQPVVWNYRFKKPLRVHTDGAGGTVSVIKDNSLHFIVVANVAGASLNYEVRVRFKG